MSRHGYTDDCEDTWAMIRWCGAVKRTLRGKPGQSFLRELLAAMDALPEPRLVASELEHPSTGEVCALGSVGRARGLDMSAVDVENYEEVAKLFGISETLAREVMFHNDDFYQSNRIGEAERRFQRVREWVLSEIRSQGELVPVGKSGEPAK
jgi:hypothetical protein